MIDYAAAGARLLKAIETIIREDDNPDRGETMERAMVQLLGIAWCEAVRAEFRAYAETDPEIKAQYAVALELMASEGYTEDAICMLPGVEAPIARVDGGEAICVDYCMKQVTPLSAIFTNQVRAVQSAAARVAKALAEEAAKAPQEWPLTIASGETFNSIEEMEQCPIDAVREMAKMMRDAEHSSSRPGGFIHSDKRTVTAGLLTCWQYFGLDGPTDLHNLNTTYTERMGRTALGSNRAKVAAEDYRQYANCLKELGASLTEA